MKKNKKVFQVLMGLTCIFFMIEANAIGNGPVCPNGDRICFGVHSKCVPKNQPCPSFFTKPAKK